MRLINEIKLDFKDVLILPKRSTLSSRREVNLERTFNFINSGKSWTGVPIIVSNMDTTGTFEMAKKLFEYKMLTCIHKHYTLEEWGDFLNDIKDNYGIEYINYFVVSIGILDNDIDKLINIKSMMESILGTNDGFICIDVANGYTEIFVQQLKKIRQLYPTNTIIAGNVVSSEMVEELILSGADLIKCGIGGGCLAEGTRVLMSTGDYKNIEDINVGEYVINMNGKPVEVIEKFDMGIKDVIKVETNMNKTIYMTPDHKIYVKDNLTLEYKWVNVENYSNELMDLVILKQNENLLLEITNINEKRQVYDIMVDCPTHSFITEDIIVHNSVCTTRIKTGVGYPQLSMVIECADAGHGLKGCIISDGGCTNSGDISKAFGAGADFVMLGGMFAGHDESAGTVIEENGVKYKEFYGMSSDTAMNKHNGGVAKYRASEGKRVLVKYRGSVEDTVNDILGGVRSTCTYVGAKSLKELSKRTTFIRVSQQSNEVYGKN
jgi:IMP dehydrogenase/GMP reductase